MTKFTEDNCGNLEDWYISDKLTTLFNLWKLLYQSENLPEYFIPQTEKKLTIPYFNFLLLNLTWKLKYLHFKLQGFSVTQLIIILIQLYPKNKGVITWEWFVF